MQLYWLLGLLSNDCQSHSSGKKKSGRPSLSFSDTANKASLEDVVCIRIVRLRTLTQHHSLDGIPFNRLPGDERRLTWQLPCDVGFISSTLSIKTSIVNIGW